MSSTSNVQNLLTNVFRPTFVYNTVTSNYQTKLELTNVDTVSANMLSAYAAAVGDVNGNVYVGVGTGNANSAMVTSGNSNNTFVGTGAGMGTSNAKNAVFLGYRSGVGVSNSSNSISIGANTLNGGNSNVYIGCGTGITTGSNNIFIGPGLSQALISNTMLIGSGSNILLNGDLSNKRVGVNLTSLPTFDPSVPILLDVNGYARVGTSNNGKMGVNIAPGYSLDVNGDMRISDGYGTLITTHDSNSNATLAFSNVRSANCNATIQASGGFFSVSGRILIAASATSNIGVVKKGVVLIHASGDNGTQTLQSARMFVVTISNSGAYSVGSLSTFNLGATISNSSSNITLSNGWTGGSLTYTYSITYFPSP